MVTHVVLMKFKPEDRAANIARAASLLRELRGKLACLRELEVGINAIASDRAFDLSLITRFDDFAGLAEYADHPLHLEVKRFLGTVLEKSHVVYYQNG
jgi:hypothetical protein